jgi:hypothetical protein
MKDKSTFVLIYIPKFPPPNLASTFRRPEDPLCFTFADEDVVNLNRHTDGNDSTYHGVIRVQARVDLLYYFIQIASLILFSISYSLASCAAQPRLKLESQLICVPSLSSSRTDLGPPTHD